MLGHAGRGRGLTKKRDNNLTDDGIVVLAPLKVSTCGRAGGRRGED